MNRVVLAVAVAGTALLTACGGTEVIVQAQVEQDGQVDALENLQIRALPYDRDAIFDSLGAAYEAPEPQIPAELAALQDSIADANTAWSRATARWNTGRDSLQQITERLQSLNRTSGEYVVLFRQSQSLFDEVERQQQTMDREFRRFEALQNRYASQAEEVQAARDQWADVAYADFDQVAAAHMAETGLKEVVDTTDANGIARLTGLKAGANYWIHTRYETAFAELYWNVPVTAQKGEPVRVQLTRDNAQVRPKL